MLRLARRAALRVFITYTHSQPAGVEGAPRQEEARSERSFLHCACCVEANKQTNNAANSNRNRNSNRKSAIERETAAEGRGRMGKGGGESKRRNKSKCNTEFCFLVELNNCGYHTAALRRRFNGAL